MAAAVRMLSVAREEIPIVAGEIASTARASTSTTTTSAVAIENTANTAIRATEMGPVAVRHMAEMSVKGAGESSILGQHLSIARSQGSGIPGKSSSLLETISHTHAGPLETPINATSSSMTQSTSIIAQTLEMDAGVSIKEAISNAGQTGVEEVVEQLGEIGKIMLEGRMTVPQVLPKV